MWTNQTYIVLTEDNVKGCRQLLKNKGLGKDDFAPT